MVRRFAAELADAGHAVHSVTITAGAARELLNADETTPLDSGTASESAEHAWREPGTAAPARVHLHHQTTTAAAGTAHHVEHFTT
jgi:hypothetical protein